MERRFFLVLVLTATLVFVQPTDAVTLPNIIVYLSDDMSMADASIYGANVVRTPTLEKLAQQGMVFDNAFIASPACAPSRAALLTGLMPARNGAEANHTYPHKGIVHLTDYLNKAGYKIYVFGKISHNDIDEQCEVEFYSQPRRNLYNNVKAVFDTLSIDGPVCLMMGDRRPHVQWIKESEYAADEVDLPAYFIDTKETREHRARYYTDITGMDDEMGQLYEYAITKLGENSIFFHSSDHGSQWPFGKWNLYDAGIRVPMVWIWPGHIAAGSRAQAMVSWVDVFPTLLELVGQQAPEGLDGKSFADVVLGKKDAHREFIFTTHSGDGNMNIYPIRSIRTNKYKFIWNIHPEYYHTNHSDILRKDGAGAYWDSWHQAAKTDTTAIKIIMKYYARPAEEFYDLEADPTEQHNLINDPSLEPIISDMRTRLKDWVKAQGDTLTVFNKPYMVGDPFPVKKAEQ